jgi:hypothetical protein
MVASPGGVEATSPRRFHLLHELLKAFDGRFFTRVRSRMRKPYFHVGFPCLHSDADGLYAKAPMRRLRHAAHAANRLSPHHDIRQPKGDLRKHEQKGDTDGHACHERQHADP